MHYQSSRLIHNNEGFIFMENIQVHLLWTRFLWRRLGEADLDPVAWLNHV